jgi:hypothetical protein
MRRLIELVHEKGIGSRLPANYHLDVWLHSHRRRRLIDLRLRTLFAIQVSDAFISDAETA